MNKHITIHDVHGKVIRDNDTYKVTDNTDLDHLVVSQTILKPNKETLGHSHEGLEEVYFFSSGMGEMIVGEESITVNSNSIVLIPAGEFHKVINSHSRPLIFTAVFEKYER